MNVFQLPVHVCIISLHNGEREAVLLLGMFKAIVAQIQVVEQSQALGDINSLTQLDFMPKILTILLAEF